MIDTCANCLEYESVAELMALDLATMPQPVVIVGKGNKLSLPEDFQGTLLHSKIRFIKYVDMGFEDVPIMVGAGVDIQEFVENTCSNGMTGAEALCTLRGEIGSAVACGVSAYGCNISNIVSGVVCYDKLEKTKVKFTSVECFGCGDGTIFEKNPGRYIITSVLFRLRRKPVCDTKSLQ